MKFRTTFLIAVCAITALSVNAKGGIQSTYGIAPRKVFIERQAARDYLNRPRDTDWFWWVTSTGELRANDWQPILNSNNDVVISQRGSEKFTITNGFEYTRESEGNGWSTYKHFPYNANPTPTDNEGYKIGDGLSFAIGYDIECDDWGGDLVLSTNENGWHPNQKAWSSAYFPWASLCIRVTNEEHPDMEITPVIELIGSKGYQDMSPVLNEDGTEDNTLFTFDPVKADGQKHTVYATADYIALTHPCRGFRITFKGSSAEMFTHVEIFSVALLSQFYCANRDTDNDGVEDLTEEQQMLSRDFPVGGSYILPWFEYDLGGRDVAYHSNEFLSGSNWGANFDRPYRVDQDSVNGMAIDGGVAIGGFNFKGTALYTSQPMSPFDRMRDMGWGERQVVTKKEIQDFFGTWYDYTFTVPEDCEANINIATFANYNDARIIEAGWGANGPGGNIIEGMDHLVWIKRYAQAYVLELDGKPLKTNQTSYPEMIKDDAVLLGSHNSGDQFREAAYTADEFFNDVLPDKTKWRSTLLPNGTASDTLFTWSYQNLGNQYTPGIPKYSTDASLGDQYQNVRLTAGTHTIRLHKLCRLNNGFRGITFDIHEKTGEWDDVMLGDVNGDGEVNVSDVVALANFAMGEIPEGFIKEAADLNNDGEVNIGDVVQLANNVMGS